MKFDLDKYPLFRDNKTSLQETSKDNSDGTNHFMTYDTYKVVNFDAVKTAYLNSNHISEEHAASVDAMLNTEEGMLYFIEFKNGELHSEKQNINRKIRDSVMIFCAIADEQIEFTRKNLRFILVYNAAKNDFNWKMKRADAMAKLGKKSTPLLELDKLEGFCYNRLEAYTAEDFNEYVLKALFRTGTWD